MPIDPRAVDPRYTMVDHRLGVVPPAPFDRPNLYTPPPTEAMFDGLEYAGHGFPVRDGEEPKTPRTAWERLTRGQPLGKKAILLYNAADMGIQKTPVPFFQLRGDNCDAQPITLMIAPPRVIAANFVETLALSNQNYQNLPGDQDNFEVSDADFPGDSRPITWPPLQVELKWGSAGAPPVRALIDCMNGVTVNLSASFVEANGFIFQSDDTGVYGTSAFYGLTAYVTPGYTRPGNAQCTVYCGSVNSLAESVVFPVPMFAKRAYVISLDSGVAPQVTVATLRFWQSVVAAGGAGAANVGNFGPQSGNQFQPVDIPNGGQYFSVLSGMGATAKFAVVFDLSI